MLFIIYNRFNTNFHSKRGGGQIAFFTSALTTPPPRVSLSQFSYYLAGFIEGDGTIIVPTSKTSLSGKSLHPIIKLVFTLNDLPFAQNLQNLIGHGNIYKGSGNYYIYQIQNIEGLIRIANLINGKMRTPKVEALHRLIQWLNNYANTSISPLPLDSSSLLYNSWLSGLTDADGYFQIALQKAVDGTVSNVKIYYRLELAKLYGKITTSGTNSYFDIMKNISEILKTPLRERDRVTNFGPSSTYFLTTSNLESNELVMNYFNYHSMYSSKFLDFQDWATILNFKLENKSSNLKGLTPNQRELCKILKEDRKSVV